MNDVSKYISPEIINQMPGFLTISDLNSKFLLGNQCAAKWMGFLNPDLMTGKTYSDAPCKVSEQHASFLNQDQFIINNESGKIFGIYCYANDDWKVILAEKFIIKDEYNNALAMWSYITDLTHSKIVDINKFISLTTSLREWKLQQTGYIIGSNKLSTIKLSARQSECLFFLLRGKNAKEISLLINLSIRTVETYIEQLKLKFHCKYKSELIEKALNLGYLNTIPEKIFELAKSNY